MYTIERYIRIEGSAAVGVCVCGEERICEWVCLGDFCATHTRVECIITVVFRGAKAEWLAHARLQDVGIYTFSEF